jgi:Putative beta-barrel porin-2, OmpL-like. bbp2
MKIKALPLLVLLLASSAVFAGTDSTAVAKNATASATPTPHNKSAISQKATAMTKDFIEVFLDKKKHQKEVDTSANAEPFSQFDQTWQNGSDRRHNGSPFAGKYFTPIIMTDVNYTASNWHPKDNTVVGSTALARNNEIEISLASLGGEFNYANVRAKIMLQFGTRAEVVPRNDASWNRGGYQINNAYRYFSEAYGGYHFNAMHGINLDAGIFMSYVGLFSYYNCENWTYQPSFTSDNTPWFFNGIRLQMFPSMTLKQEIWIINGWQTYGKFNNMPGLGSQTTWVPKEYFKLMSNNYFGTDVANNPKCFRFHSDNSIVVRYYNHPNAAFSKAAFSVTADLGFQEGGGLGGFGAGLANGGQSNFLCWMAYNNLWFGKDHFSWSVGGGMIHNPGRYLVLAPSGDADPNINPATGQTIGTHPYSMNPGDPFDGWDISTGLNYMPNDFITFMVQVVYRHTNEAYFAGPGGVTSPDGYNGTAITPGWAPDLRKEEGRFIAAMLVRL